jgi:NADPH:quinone reductase-like Zn-dependent oxidoreductase
VKAVTFDRHGAVALSEVAAAAPGAGEVAIDVRFAGINPTDTYHRRRVTEGSDELERIAGVEVAGIVSALGPGANRWSVGDRVFGLVHDGGLAERVVATERLLVAMPDGLAERAAAAVPEAFITAHDGISQGGLTPDQTLLVSGASGGVGLAAVQIGRAMGSRVIGVCRSDAGRQLLRRLDVEAFGFRPVERSGEPLPYRDEVDVVVELVGAVNARADLEALRARGRMVFIAAQGNEDITFNLREFKTKRGMLIGSTLRRRGLDAKVAAVEAFAADVVPMLEAGAAHPIESRTFAASEAAAAFEFMATPGKLGKVLLEF